jgi:hypothetical protein
MTIGRRTDRVDARQISLEIERLGVPIHDAVRSVPRGGQASAGLRHSTAVDQRPRGRARFSRDV